MDLTERTQPLPGDEPAEPLVVALSGAQRVVWDADGAVRVVELRAERQPEPERRWFRCVAA